MSREGSGKTASAEREIRSQKVNIGRHFLECVRKGKPLSGGRNRMEREHKTQFSFLTMYANIRKVWVSGWKAWDKKKQKIKRNGNVTERRHIHAEISRIKGEPGNTYRKEGSYCFVRQMPNSTAPHRGSRTPTRNIKPRP